MRGNGAWGGGRFREGGKEASRFFEVLRLVFCDPPCESWAKELLPLLVDAADVRDKVQSKFATLANELPAKPHIGTNGSDLIGEIVNLIPSYQQALAETKDACDGATNMLPGRKQKLPSEPMNPSTIDFKKFDVCPAPKAKAKGKGRGGKGAA